MLFLAQHPTASGDSTEMKPLTQFFISCFIFQCSIRNCQMQDRSTRLITPEHYSLWVVPFLNNFTYWGRVSVNFTVMNFTNQVTLNVENLNIQNFAMKGLAQREMSEFQLNTEQNLENWFISAKQAMRGRYNLDISFTGRINDIAFGKGFYYYTYIDDEIKTTYVATQSRSWENYIIFPCFNEPVLRAPFTVHIARFTNQSSQSNMPLASTSLPEASLEGRVWDTYSNSPNLSIHEVHLSVHSLVQTNAARRNYSVLAVKDSGSQAALAAALLPRAADLFQLWLLDLPPPALLPKLDVLALPGSTPETWHLPGLVICSEEQILFKEGVSNVKSEQLLVLTVAKIVSRQWLSLQLPLPDWLHDDISTYLQYKLASKMEPSWRFDELFTVDISHQTMQEQFDEENRPEEMSSLLYKKIAVILRMVERLTTEDVVRKSLHQFIERRGLVNARQLFNILGSHSTALHTSYNNNQSTALPLNLSIPEILYSWSSAPGYPVVTINATNSTLSIKQRDILQNGTQWSIPLTFTTENALNNNKTANLVWISNDDNEVVLPFNESSGWVLFNINQSGNYRVNYNTRNWELLTNQLMRNYSLIPAVTRSQLIDDVFKLAQTEMVDFSVAFTLSRYLKSERDYLPWLTAARNFEQLVRLFYGTKLASDLEEFVRTLYLPYYNATFRMFTATDTHMNRLMRLDGLYWACHWRLDSCLNFATSLFKQWQSVSYGFPTEYKPTVLCAGVRHFPHVFYEVFDQFTQSTVEADRGVFLSALACTRNSSHLYYLLKTALLDKNQLTIGHNEIFLLVKQILATPDNVQPVAKFLVQNYDTALSVVGTDMMHTVWSCIGQSTRLDADFKLLHTLAQNESLISSLQESLNSSVATAEKSRQKSERLAPLVATALRLVSPPLTSSGPALLSHSISTLTMLPLLLFKLLFF